MSTGTASFSSERLVRQLSRLVEVSVTLNSTLELDQLLQFIIDSAAELIECEAASILLFDEKRCELFFASSTGTDPEQLKNIPVPLENSIAGTIFRENRPMVINEVENDPRHYSQVGQQIQFQSRSLLGVPMRIRSRVIGVLEGVNKISGAFTEEDVRLLSIIASQAAVAINNARLVQALQKAYDELRRVDKVKSDFMAIASHELRTPLGVILGYASFLKEDAQGELSEHAERVLNSALKLRGLVEDMTNLNFLQLGSITLDLHTIPIQQIIHKACNEVRNMADAKEHILEIKLPKQPLMVKADPEKLEQVFTNLLNNAIRFTPIGGLINVGAREHNHETWVEVNDTGIGIPSQELENIFKEFYQVEDHLRRRAGGLGLGLAIASALVRLHNGRLWAESKGEGQGASFKVVLPSEAQPQL